MAAPIRTPRESWIDAGLTALASGGPEAVRIEQLAQTLGVSKGGFYWHFDDRPALLGEMLDAWERLVVDEAIDRVERGGGDARAKLRRLFALSVTFRGVFKAELAIRDWARRDRAVARRLRRVDNRRMDYLRGLFADFCPERDEVEVRSTLVMTMFVGSNFIAVDHDGRTRADVLGLVLERLLQ